MDEDLFFALSVALTGEPTLNYTLAAGLLARLQKAPEAAALPQLLQTYSAILAQSGEQHDELIREQIMKNDALLKVAKMLVVIWYTGDLQVDKPSPMAPEHHFEGVVWRIASAHPPGLSGGYFGHWTYPPDN